MADAVIDALSAFVQSSVYTPSSSSSLPTGKELVTAFHSASKVSFLVGQYIQLAFILQLVLIIPLLLVWVSCMEQVVLWFVNYLTIAFLAKDYGFVVVFAYLVQSPTRTLTVAFHIGGHDHFESFIDAVASMLQLITIAGVVALDDYSTLVTGNVLPTAWDL